MGPLPARSFGFGALASDGSCRIDPSRGAPSSQRQTFGSIVRSRSTYSRSSSPCPTGFPSGAGSRLRSGRRLLSSVFPEITSPPSSPPPRGYAPDMDASFAQFRNAGKLGSRMKPLQVQAGADLDDRGAGWRRNDLRLCLIEVEVDEDSVQERRQRDNTAGHHGRPKFFFVSSERPAGWISPLPAHQAP